MKPVLSLRLVVLGTTPVLSAQAEPRPNVVIMLADGLGWRDLVADPDYELSADNMFREAWIPLIKQGGYRNWQLLDLESDPAQQRNLAEQQPAVLDRLKTVAGHQHQCHVRFRTGD